MQRRRLLLLPLIVLILSAGTASAASWQAFSSKSLGFALRYPTGWKALSITQPGAPQIQFSRAGTVPYTVNVTVLSLNGGSSLSTLTKRFVAYEQRAGNASVAAMHWKPVTLAHHRGIGAVYVPATEGGVSVSNGMYVVPWKKRTYVINLQSVQKPAPTSLNRFPAIYQQILASWRFL